jgi:hypothetical protein
MASEGLSRHLPQKSYSPLSFPLDGCCAEMQRSAALWPATLDPAPGLRGTLPGYNVRIIDSHPPSALDYG